MVAHFFTTLGELLTGFLNLVVNATSGVVAIFYDTTSGFTIYGIFLLIGLALMFLNFAFRMIQSFIAKKG